MRKLWLAVRHEYSKNVRQKSFLIALFSLPLFIGLSVGLGFLFNSQENNSAPVGIIDYPGVIDQRLDLSQISERELVDFVIFESEELARESLEIEDIQAYFIIPNDYPKNKEIDLVFNQEPGENAISNFYDFMQLNLVSGFRPEIRERVALGTNAVFRTPDGEREFPDNQPSVGMFLPLIISLGFVLLLMITSGYLMSGFLDEKANRTIELLITSLSPTQFVGSKLMTMVAIGMTMLITWVLVAVGTFYVGGGLLEISWMQGLELNWRDIFAVVAVAVPSYMFAAAIMLAIGLIIGDKQEAESVGPLIMVVAFIPLWLLVTITNDINGPLAIGMSLIPIASQLTMGIRTMFFQVPLWQILVSVAIQLLFVAAALWLAVRTFRIGILRTGKRIRWHELIAKRGKLTSEGGR
jgi:ABC-2 type transport system permease protein